MSLTREQKTELLAAMEDVTPFIAAWTGIKAQFVEAGWSPQNAELMTLELWRANNKTEPTS